MGAKMFEMSIRRKAKGTEVYIKSEPLEKLAKEWSNGTEADLYAGPLSEAKIGETLPDERRYYRLAQRWPTQVRQTWGIVADPSQEFVIEGKINLSYFTVKGLGQGVTFTLAYPMSKSMLREAAEHVKELAAMILSEFAGPAEAHVVLTERDTVVPAPSETEE